MANCITLDKIVIAPTAKSPPYFNNDELKHNIKTLSVACIAKGATPKAIHGNKI